MSDMTELIKPGDRVILHFESQSLSNEESEGKDYFTKIYDIENDEDILLFMPMEKTRLILLPVGAEYEASFFGSKSIYGAKVRIAERYKQDSMFLLKLELITDLAKQQRREFFRYDCIIGMMARQLSKEEKDKFEEKHTCEFLPSPESKAVVVDISGGGMRFVTADKFEQDSYCHVRFILPIKDASKKFDLVIHIVGVQPVANNPANTEFRGPYYMINENDRDDIIKFIFEEERRQRAGKSR